MTHGATVAIAAKSCKPMSLFLIFLAVRSDGFEVFPFLSVYPPGAMLGL